ncbi:HD domain-containing phosphohydrolase [Deinococcus knuensis]|uniref:GAF domain-containing protein n=1 Tax=Deinococcus knuensis TaxID=1837380 RepID=A0ABQ2SWP1_9DEIO|nr:HD domain-containing phosphohydrolase [Deinococcus knuensis]GGS42399.1 hypothetical protein GCM10008961_37000 [Deinococcus knuensis]
MTLTPPLDSESLLLNATRQLLALGSAAELCREGLRFMARELNADLGMLHLAVTDTDFRLVEQVGDHPLLHRHQVQIMEPGWVTLLTAGTWISSPVPSPDWTGPDERNYVHLGARHLVNFGLYSGQRLIGTVNLLFNRPRADLNELRVLGTIGALWGTLLERLETEATLRTREAMLRTVTDQGTDLVTVVRPDGQILYQSRGGPVLLGRSAEGMHGRNVLEGIHPDDLSAAQRALAELAATPDATCTLTYRVTHRSGGVVWLESHGRNLLDEPAVGGLVVHSRDVTAQVASKRSLERRVQELTLMHATSLQLQEARSVQEIASRVVRLIEGRLGHPFVWLAERVGDGLIMRASDCRRESTLLDAAHSLPVDQGLCGASVRTGQTLMVGDVTQDARYSGIGHEVRSELVTPIRVAGRVWGVLNVESPQLNAFDDEDRQALETVAAQTGAALANVLLLADLRDSRDALSSAYERTIEGWARALDFRDRETEGHSQRVTELTVALARRMGVPPDELVHVRRGALLHDIGKMGIPDSILLKPGQLDENEWRVMRRHPDMALELLEPIEFLRPALDIPHAHHEKWNGAGYPRGLKGEQIPLSARIFAVIDVWDALRHDRPYRPAWDEARARALIEAESGVHFDPQVARAFLDWLTEAGAGADLNAMLRAVPECSAAPVTDRG